MAFVARTKRETGAYAGRTPDRVGPGSYNVERAQASSANVSYAPFSTSSERGIDTDPNQYITPSAGEYQSDIFSPKPAVTVSSGNFVSRVPRFFSESVRSPGPGAYNCAQSGWLKSQSRPRRQKRGVVSWEKLHKPPSIPSNAQSYGYEENAEGDLVLQPPPAVGHTGRLDDVVGVGEYSPALPQGYSSGGVDFGRLVARVPIKTLLTPGPGTYSHSSTQKKVTQNFMFKSNTKRYKLLPAP